MTQLVNEYKGFSLFNDIEDKALRIRNRAVMLANMASNHSKERRITAQGASLILNYFNLVDPNEKQEVQNAFMIEMNHRGFHLVRAKV